MSKPRLKLVGEDGNIFFILGMAALTAKEAGWDFTEIAKFKEEAMSGNYNHALATCTKYFDVY